MSDAPRWPGSDGGPGLDFSPYRKDSDEPAKPKPSSSPADDTQVHSPFSGGSAAERDEPAKPEEQTRDLPPVTPRVAERAARTAQEWAGTPVGAETRSGGAGAAGAVGAASAVPAPQGAPMPSPASRFAGAPADADPLPLADVGERQGASGRPESAVRRPRRTRKARLRLARLDPWSVMKTTFLFAIAFGVMTVVATFVIWSVLAGAGTLEYVNTLLNQLFGDQNTEFDVTQILSLNRILGFSAIVSAINVVIITALATLFSFLYNLAATAMGGLEVTLAED